MTVSIFANLVGVGIKIQKNTHLTEIRLARKGETQVI
jgi:hypothetical protein